MQDFNSQIYKRKRRKKNSDILNEIILDNMQAGLIMIDKKFNVLKINDQAQKIFNIDDITGKNIKYIKKLSNLVRITENAFHSSEDYSNCEFIFNRKTIGFTTLKHYFGSNPKRNNFIAMFLKDISSIKEDMSKNIENERIFMMTNLLSGIAHELNNPLMYVTGRLEYLLMMKNSYDNKTVESLEEISTDIIRIGKIINDLLALAKKQKLTLEKADIKDLLTNAIEFSKIKRRNLNIRIEKDIFNLEIKCNPATLIQVFINIFNNAVFAIKETDNKDGLIKIKTNIEKDKKNVKISIANNGKLISKSIMNKIFEPFYTTKNEKHGTGLGLAISKKIILNHFGNIYADIKNDMTHFHIILPMD